MGVQLLEKPMPTRDLALRQPITCSSSKSDERAAAFAVDGMKNTRWTSIYADNQWLAVDLGTAYPLKRIAIRWERACAENYDLEGSLDGSSWSCMSHEQGRE